MNQEKSYEDSVGFEVIGREYNPTDIELDMSEVERLREVGRRVMFCEASTTGVHEDEIQSTLVAPRQLGGFIDDSVPYIYVSALEDYLEGEEDWKTRLRYHKYNGTKEDSLDLIAEYYAEVHDGEVAVAKRSLYRTRSKEQLYATGEGLELEKFDRRTMAETSLSSANIDTLEDRVARLIRRVEASKVG